jgi:hypothetical protein
MFRQRWLLGGALVWLVAAGAAACGSDGSSSEGHGGSSEGGAATGGAECSGGSESTECGCSRSEVCCDGACVDLTSDAENCGQCGRACSPKHGTGTCMVGECTVDACDDGFVDCNGEAADGCEAKDDGLPDAPRPLSPAIGHSTGSARNDAARMPELRWTPATSTAGSCGAVTYQVQLDDSCAVGEPCEFESPEADASGIEETRYRPGRPLDVSTAAPVGTRYFWRVRACETEVRCSEWSEQRYMNVGRLNDDINGDGYSDVFATSYDGEAGYHLHLRAGPLPADGAAAGSIVRPSLNLIAPIGFYGYARFLGDVNGDGFADAIRSIDSGAELLLGNDDFQKVTTIKVAGDFDGQHGVASLGDWNGDGFADFAVSDSRMTETPASVVHVYAGNADAKWLATNITAPSGTTVASFGTALEGGLDFDGDGYTDLFILDGNEGRVHFAAGGPDGPGKIKASLATGTTCEYYIRPTLARAGDMNGDGYGDVAVRCDSRLQIFAGGRTPSLMPLWSHQFSDDGRSLGHGVAGGTDLGSDGFADLLVHGDDVAGPNLYTLAGSATLSDADVLVPFRGALSKDGKATAGDGLSAGDFDGDGRPDLLVQVKTIGEVRVLSGGKTMSGSCAAASDVETVGDWCRSAVMTIEGKYATESNPDYPIGNSFGAMLAQ